MIGERINGSTADQLRRRLLRHRLGWSPWPDQGLCPTSDHHLRTRAFVNINSISIMILEESSMELGGSTSTLPSSDRAVFLDSELVSAATTSSSIALTIALVELCGIESITTLENFVEFRWRNLWQSTIYRSLVKSGRSDRAAILRGGRYRNSAADQRLDLPKDL